MRVLLVLVVLALGCEKSMTVPECASAETQQLVREIMAKDPRAKLAGITADSIEIRFPAEMSVQRGPDKRFCRAEYETEQFGKDAVNYTVEWQLEAERVMWVEIQ